MNELCYNASEGSNLELEFMEKRKKEILVKEKHKNKILEPTEKYPYYKTRIPGNKQIVKKDYSAVIDALYNYYYQNGNVLTLEDAFYKWLEHREDNVEYLTSLHYKASFKKHVEGTSLAKKDISAITKLELYDFFENIAKNGNGISKKALNDVKTIINGSFDYAYLQGIECIDARRISIRDLIRKCEPPKSRGECYTREEAETLVRYLETQKESVYTLGVRLMFCLPVRIGELLAIRWSNYDQENGLLTIDGQMITKQTDKANRETVRVDYTKCHSESGKRTIQVSDYAAFLLEKLKALNGDKDYILQSKGQLPISKNQFNDHLKAYCEACEIEYKSSHKIRFYACSMMYYAGIDEKTIQRNMGHSGLEMTRHYDRRAQKPVDKDILNKTLGFEIPLHDFTR